jgi:hypothetical protein
LGSHAAFFDVPEVGTPLFPAHTPAATPVRTGFAALSARKLSHIGRCVKEGGLEEGSGMQVARGLEGGEGVGGFRLPKSSVDAWMGGVYDHVFCGPNIV